MIKRVGFYTLLLLTTNVSFAVTCFYSFMKDNCWTNYDVTVDVTDAVTGDALVHLTVPSGTSWGRETFACHPSQSLDFKATFTPVIWKNDAGKVYHGKSSWTLPPKVDEGKTAWNLTVCFPSEFSGVPMPPTASGECKCLPEQLPAVKAPEK